MRIKLLDRDDIRRLGGTVVDLPDHIAQGLIDRWHAVKIDAPAPVAEKKSIDAPPMNKAVWTPPEEKAMQMAKSGLLERKPKANDPLFPKSIIG